MAIHPRLSGQATRCIADSDLDLMLIAMTSGELNGNAGAMAYDAVVELVLPAVEIRANNDCCNRTWRSGHCPNGITCQVIAFGIGGPEHGGMPAGVGRATGEG